MSTAVILSPHLDDAAFSCGGTIRRLSNDGWRVIIVTAFTRSVPDPAGFALRCQTDKGLPADADYMALRRMEDAGACLALGCEPRWLDLPEAPHRGYESAAELFGPYSEHDTIFDELACLLRIELTDLRPDWLAVPQGLGGHVDHRRLVEALLSLGRTCPVGWYRDTPYAYRDPSAAPLPSVPAGAEWAEDIADTLAAKLSACAAYRTQLGFQFGGVAAMRERLTAFARAEGDAACGGGVAERWRGASWPVPSPP